MVSIIIFEFYSKSNSFNPFVTFFGFAIFFMALLLRWKGILILGDRWSIHSISKINTKSNNELIKTSLYKYIRHPIYLGFILEILSLPLILNLYFTFYFSVIFFVPLILYKAYLEEKELIREFKDEYTKYRAEVAAFVPLKVLK